VSTSNNNLKNTIMMIKANATNGWDLEDIGQFSVSREEWNNYTNNEFEDMGLAIVNNQFNGDLAKAYDTIVGR